MNVRLSDLDTVFSTRQRGAEVRAWLEEQIAACPTADPLVVDFRDVLVISNSCADEAIAKLFATLSAGNFDRRVLLLANMNDDVYDAVDTVLQRRSCLALGCNNGWLLLGKVPSQLVDTIDALARRGEATAADLAKDLATSAQAVNNRLKQLWEAGTIVRKLAVPSSGGREYVYQSVVPKNATVKVSAGV